MDFPGIKTEDALAATYGMGVQATNPSHSVLGVQLDDVGGCQRSGWKSLGDLRGSHAWLCTGPACGCVCHLSTPPEAAPTCARNCWWKAFKRQSGPVPFLPSCAGGHSPVTRDIPAQNTSVLHHASPRLHPRSCKHPQLSHFPSLLFI